MSRIARCRGFAFQSTPAIAGGRTDQLAIHNVTPIGFNPRPPLLAGEPVLVPLLAIARWFQSTPAIAGGRTHVAIVFPAEFNMFQSTPAIAGGRTSQSTSRAAIASKRFNPRPPLLAGEPRRLPHTQAQTILFQSTPAIAGGRTLYACVPSQALTAFQSTPAIAGGRTIPTLIDWPDSGCFNPRPPLLAGEPLLRQSFVWKQFFLVFARTLQQVH